MTSPVFTRFIASIVLTLSTALPYSTTDVILHPNDSANTAELNMICVFEIGLLIIKAARYLLSADCLLASEISLPFIGGVLCPSHYLYFPHCKAARWPPFSRYHSVLFQVSTDHTLFRKSPKPNCPESVKLSPSNVQPVPLHQRS